MPTPTTFASVLRPQLLAAKWPIIFAIILTGISGVAISYQNVFPKWLFSDVLEPTGIDPAERWRRLLWLLGGYLAISFLLRMALWYVGYSLYHSAMRRRKEIAR